MLAKNEGGHTTSLDAQEYSESAKVSVGSIFSLGPGYVGEGEDGGCTLLADSSTGVAEGGRGSQPGNLCFRLSGKVLLGVKFDCCGVGGGIGNLYADDVASVSSTLFSSGKFSGQSSFSFSVQPYQHSCCNGFPH